MGNKTQGTLLSTLFRVKHKQGNNLTILKEFSEEHFGKSVFASSL